MLETLFLLKNWKKYPFNKLFSYIAGLIITADHDHKIGRNERLIGRELFLPIILIGRNLLANKYSQILDFVIFLLVYNFMRKFKFGQPTMWPLLAETRAQVENIYEEFTVCE